MVRWAEQGWELGEWGRGCHTDPGLDPGKQTGQATPHRWTHSATGAPGPSWCPSWGTRQWEQHFGTELYGRGPSGPCGEKRDRRELLEHLAGPAVPAGRSGPLPPDVLAVPAAALPAVEPQRGCSPAHPARPCGEPSDSGPITKRSHLLLAGQSLPRPGW